MKNKVLVFGGSGFIGKHLVKLLKSLDYDVWWTRHSMGSTNDTQWTEVDVTNYWDVHDIISTFKPDAIVNLAGIASPTKSSETIVNANVVGTHNILKAFSCQPNADKLFVLASSIVVYGDKDYPCYETEFFEPKSVYAASKLAAESFLIPYSNKMKCISLRFGATVGDGMTHGVVRDVVDKLYQCTNTLELLGDSPGSAKPYTHVSDVCNIIERTIDGFAMRQNGRFSVYNTCVDDNLDILALACLAMQVTKKYKEIKFLGETVNNKGDNKKLLVNNDKVKATFGYKFKYPKSSEAICQAIKEYITS